MVLKEDKRRTGPSPLGKQRGVALNEDFLVEGMVIGTRHLEAFTKTQPIV